jgi:hypothetical protein
MSGGGVGQILLEMSTFYHIYREMEVRSNGLRHDMSQESNKNVMVSFTRPPYLNNYHISLLSLKKHRETARTLMEN